MPLRYKLPAYAGNALLLLLGFIMIASGGGDGLSIGSMLGALAALNLFLVYKFDQFFQEEAWLAHELEVTKIREELLVAQKRLRELEGSSSAPKQ